MKRSTTNVLAYASLVVFMIITVFPFFWAIMVSLRSRADLFSQRFVFFAPLSMDGYSVIFSDPAFMSAMMNTIVLVAATTIITLLLGAPAGYSIARYNVGGKTLLLGVLALRFFPVAIIIIPAYLFFNTFGLIDRMASIVTMFVFISLPLVIWILRGFVMGVPKELEESAMIDGCSLVGAIFRITIPLCSQGVVVAAVFPFIYSWNNMLVPLVLTLFRWSTLTTYASIFVTDMRIEWGAVMAVVVVMLLPVALVVVSVRKHLLQGFAGSGIK